MRTASPMPSGPLLATGAEVAAILDCARQVDSVAASRALGVLGGDDGDVGELIRRYRHEYTPPLERLDESLAALFLSHFGSKTRRPAHEFEALLRLEGLRTVVTPMWILARPIVGARRGRLPAVPSYVPVGVEWLQAYLGLALHVERLLAIDGEPPEMWLTSIAWRVVGIAEGIANMQQAGGLSEISQGASLSLVRRAVQGKGPMAEHAWWGAFNDRFVKRRNVFTHLGHCDQGWVFSEHVADWSRDDAVDAAAAISNAVFHYMQQEITADPSPPPVAEQVLGKTQWLADFR